MMPLRSLPKKPDEFFQPVSRAARSPRAPLPTHDANVRAFFLRGDGALRRRSSPWGLGRQELVALLFCRTLAEAALIASPFVVPPGLAAARPLRDALFASWN